MSDSHVLSMRVELMDLYDEVEVLRAIKASIEVEKEAIRVEKEAIRVEQEKQALRVEKEAIRVEKEAIKVEKETIEHRREEHRISSIETEANETDDEWVLV